MLKKFILLLSLFSSNIIFAKYITVKNGDDCIHIFDDDETELAALVWKTSFSSMSQITLTNFPEYMPALRGILTVGYYTFGTESNVHIINSIHPFHDYITNYSHHESRRPSYILEIRLIN